MVIARAIYLVCLGTLAVLAAAGTAYGQTGRLIIGGLASTADLEGRDDYEQYEGYLTYRVERLVPGGRGLRCASVVTAAAGVIEAEDGDHFLASFGPAWGFRWRPYMVEFGCRFAWVDDYELGSRDLGGPFQIINHIRVAAAPVRFMEVGIRLQHMSNGYIYEDNPGLDLILVDIGITY